MDDFSFTLLTYIYFNPYLLQVDEELGKTKKINGGPFFLGPKVDVDNTRHTLSCMIHSLAC